MFRPNIPLHDQRVLSDSQGSASSDHLTPAPPSITLSQVHKKLAEFRRLHDIKDQNIFKRLPKKELRVLVQMECPTSIDHL